jgi:hypothetical protein
MRGGAPRKPPLFPCRTGNSREKIAAEPALLKKIALLSGTYDPASDVFGTPWQENFDNFLTLEPKRGSAGI